MSFAIIETGGKQYKVSASKILEIEKINVKKGETIGLVGKTGNVSEIQLHFEIRKGKEAVNPLKYLT